jgi:DGQHR domain-containing protein
MASPNKTIKRRALKIEQDPKHPLIVFSLTGDDLFKIAEISRISRDDAGKLIGYQRPEVKKHIQDIVDYLDSGDVLFPNAIILALSSRAKFTSSRGPEVDDGCAIAGTVEIPLPQGDEPKPAWIVDGQQRTIALCKSRKNKLGVPVCAFIADDVPIQKDQFFRINTTRPLPRGLISELLPEVSTNLPSRLASKQIPAAIVEWLATEANSPFFRLIRRSSMKPEDASKAPITDSSLMKAIEESISSPNGCLYPFRNVTTNETDFEGDIAMGAASVGRHDPLCGIAVLRLSLVLVRANQLLPKLFLQLRPVQTDELIRGTLERLQSTSAPDTARGDCRETRNLRERDAT